MDCTEAGALTGRYIDGELDAATRDRVDAHLAGCAACREQYDAARNLGVRVRRQAQRFAAPAHLAARIAAALDAQAATGARPRFTAWRQLGLAASFVLAMVFSSGLTWLVADTGRTDRLADQVVASHVRSLMVEHLTDVASSDQHTVKPWFAGRLDLSPPVRDLTVFGYPLVGGRLDYLDGRPVAALVYRHRQHPINLFVWPAGGSAGVFAPAVRQGYNLRSWRDGGITFWAVSDLNPADLEKFELIVRSQSD
ncbi:MAG: anti-sigma factor [Rhodospirillales bacterium]|nr:anti-sigma factor [Rhodospirillales bacterium]